MRVVTFNVNGIRARLHQLRQLIADYNPDVIGLQETKVPDDQFPREEVEELGYHVSFHGQKSHYGVALMSREKPLSIQCGYEHDEDDAQKRFIVGEFACGDGKITIANGYFPQGESRDHPIKFPAKAKFYGDLIYWLERNNREDSPLILMGDLNISPTDQDIGIGEDNAKRWLRTGKCSFLPEEREWLRHVTDQGLMDVYRKLHPEVSDRFSWFDYRSRGFEREPKRGLRIDLILANAMLADKASASGIAYDIRGMERPSDHCPVWADFEVSR
ncbi:MAG: exodeoxyribonuclease III [Alteromonadaceae bacterium]|nr:exodeoxyribonuclease III [Alteromonadaceae bacterium]|tara:strand:- start:832 stop:1650 length:819 start_codon:yes stop_codon:yes gene_type:complete